MTTNTVGLFPLGESLPAVAQEGRYARTMPVGDGYESILRASNLLIGKPYLFDGQRAPTRDYKVRVRGFEPPRD